MGIFDKVFKPIVDRLKKKRDVEGLLNALNNKENNVKESTEALGVIRDKSTVIQALKDTDSEVRREEVKTLEDANFTINIHPDYKMEPNLHFCGYGHDFIHYDTSIHTMRQPMINLIIDLYVRKKPISDNEVLLELKKIELDVNSAERGMKVIKSEYTTISGHPTYHLVYSVGTGGNKWYIVTKKIRYELMMKTYKGEVARGAYSEKELEIYHQNIRRVENMINSIRIDADSIELYNKDLKDIMETIKVNEEQTAVEYIEFKIFCPLCNHEFEEIKVPKGLGMWGKTFDCEGCGQKVHAMNTEGKLKVSMETLPIGKTAESHEYEPI